MTFKRASNQLPNGILYIDTVDGQNIDANVPSGINRLVGGGQCTPRLDFASVAIHGNAADPSGTFSGMIIVAGGFRSAATSRCTGWSTC